MSTCRWCGASVSDNFCVKCHALNLSFTQPCLLGLYGPYKGKPFYVPANGLRVGRAQDQNQFVIDDPELSRQHAILSLEAQGAVRLTSKGQNGTFVNGQRVDERVLQPGDEIRFGFRRENHFVFQPAGVSNLRRDPASGRLFPIPPETLGSSPGSGQGDERFGAGRVAQPGTMYASAAVARRAGTVVMSEHEEDTPQRRLQLVLDQYAVRDIPLEGSRLEFGRTEGAGKLLVEHPSISSRHAEIVIDKNGAILRDLGSSNGTFVNGERIVEARLNEGDLIQFGACESYIFLYRESRRRALILRDIELDKPVVTIGRDQANTIPLPHPTVSSRHAEVRKVANKFELIDLNSTNGTFVNGRRIARHVLQPGDRIGLGAVQFVFDGSQMEQQADGTRIRLTARALRVETTDFNTGKPLRLLDDVSLAIQPCEFVGLLGPSGAGKSTLMDALNGSRPAGQGSVRLNSADLYSEFASLRALIGYVPQEDILHRQLSVKECLYYSARLRLPDDFGETEIWNRVDEIIKVLDLTERADIIIAKISGGQRKRVSLGIELLSKPALLFLDEPTAGQDPRTEMAMMQLFRQIANRGSTVVINTHLLGSFSLLDKVAVLVRGKLAYFGESQEMLSYFQTRRPHEIFDKLKEQEPEQWAAQYRQSEAYQESVGSVLKTVAADKKRPAAEHGQQPRRSFWRQLTTLLSRQFTLKFKEKSTLATLLLPPVVVAILMGIMKQTVNEPKVLFMIVLVALWFGCSSSVREIVDELPVYKRERQRDLKLSSYVGSKLIYVGAVAAMQSLLFIAVLAGMGAVENHLAECFALMWLLTLVGGLMGLLISSVFSTAEKALYVFPLTMIPQMLLAGLLIPVNTIHSFYAVERPNQQVELQELPAALIPTGMTPALKYGLSPLMVSRWGLEGIADLYIHDGEKYSYLLLNNIYTSLHPDELAKARAEAERKIREADPRPAKLGPTAFWRYFGIVAGYGGLLIGGIIIALRRKEHHAG